MKRALPFLFILKLSIGYSQVPIDAIIDFYKKEKICYKYEKRIYRPDSKTWLGFQGEIYSLKKGEFLTYFATHYCPDKPYFRFEIIKNQNYFGANVFQVKKFIDLSAQPENKQYFGEGVFPKDYLVSPENVRQLIADKDWRGNPPTSKDEYVLSYHDTVFKEHEILNKKSMNAWEIKISRKNYSITSINLYVHSFWDNLERRDTQIVNYSYFTCSEKEINKRIDEFKPFPIEKKQEKSPGNILIDTIQVFPNFHLTDTSLKLVSGSDISARFVLAEFWYKSCGPCISNMKQIEFIKRSFADTFLHVLAINVHDKVDEDMKKMLIKLDKSFIFLFEGQELSKKLAVQGYPTLVIYENKTKKIVYRSLGASPNIADEIKEYFRLHPN